MARPKLEYDIEEVNEIIKLTLEELMNIKEKLTPNRVFSFNKKIAAKDSSYERENGKKFKLYGYHFWYTETEFGRKKIEEIKSEKDEFVLAGKSFKPEIADIFTLVNKYHKKPEELTNRLIRLFEQDRFKMKMLEEQNQDLNEKVIASEEKLKKYKQVFLSIFMESINATNSLKDVASLKKSEDGLINDELRDIFGNEILPHTDIEDTINPVKIDFESTSARKSRRELLENIGL